MYCFTVMHRNTPLTDVSVYHKLVSINKLVADSIIQSFGGNDLSLDRVYRFLKSRC